MVELNLAVSTEAKCEHLNCFDHGLVAAHGCPIGTYRRPGPLEQPNICSGSPDISHGNRGIAGEVTGSEEAGGRPGQDGFNWPVLGEGSRHQRPIATDNHQRRVNLAFGKNCLGGSAEFGNEPNQLGVKETRQRSLRAIELG